MFVSPCVVVLLRLYFGGVSRGPTRGACGQPAACRPASTRVVLVAHGAGCRLAAAPLRSARLPGCRARSAHAGGGRAEKRESV